MFDMSDAELIGMLAFLAFGGTVAALFGRVARAAQRVLGMGHAMFIRTKDGQIHKIENVLVTLNTPVVKSVVERLTDGNLPMRPVDFSGIKERETEFVASAVNKNKATFAVNTFQAMANGNFNYVCGESDSEDAITSVTLDDFNEAVPDFFDSQVQGEIPHHFEQMAAFFTACTPTDGEFVVAWAERLVLTSERLVILTQGATPTVKADIPIGEVDGFGASNQTTVFFISDRIMK